MISNKLLDELNTQINLEFYSSYLYLAMAAYCEDNDLNGFANFFRVQAQEEQFHAMKFYNYIIDRDGRVILNTIEGPKNEFNSVLDVFKYALDHEIKVTGRIYLLTDIATDEREHATLSFLKWFIDEQVEEESTFKSLLKRLEQVKDTPAGLYMLNQELSQRVFTPPAK